MTTDHASATFDVVAELLTELVGDAEVLGIEITPETTFHERHTASRRVLEKLLHLGVVHERRDANDKATHSGPFLGRTFDGVPQEADERVAKMLRREECFGSESALPLCVRPEGAQE